MRRPIAIFGRVAKVASLALGPSIVVGCRQLGDIQRREALFAGTPSHALRGKANELQQEYVRAILRRLDENPAYAPYQNKAQAIREAFDAVQAALERRRALLRAEDQVELDLKHVVMEVCEAYNACEPRLRLLFPNQPSLVERFFMPLRRRRSRSAAAEVEVEAQEVM